MTAVDLRFAFDRLVAPRPVETFDGAPFVPALVVSTPAAGQEPTRITLSRTGCELTVAQLDAPKRTFALHDHRTLSSIYAAQFNDVLPITEHEYARFVAAVRMFGRMSHHAVFVGSPTARRVRSAVVLAIAVAVGVLFATGWHWVVSR